MTDSAFFTPLSHEGVLAVRGPDAGKFLQGQLTCNIAYLNDSHSSLGARCTAKGRMQSSFRIVAEGDGFLLAMASELLDAQLAELKKYAVFSKCTLADESDAWRRFGVSGQFALPGFELPLASDAVAADAELRLIGLGGQRHEAWVRATQADSVREKIAAQLPEGDLDAWLLGQVRAGVGQVFGATRELFIPQMINLQAVGGVSFKKGCYTGQEIVARMQYLGRLKRRLYHLALAEGEPPAAGSQLFSPVHASSVGEVVLAAPTGNGGELLAVLQEDAAADGRVHLGASDGPRLDLLDLPYTLDRDREIQR